MAADATVAVQSDSPPFRTTVQTGSGHPLLSDEPAANGGQNTGPDPIELLLSSLGACTSITLQLYAARKAWPLTGVAVTLALTYDVGGAPTIGLTVALQGTLSEEQRARLLTIASQCPVHKLLAQPVALATTLLAGA